MNLDAIGILEEDKQSLIELIKWYRDEYHKVDFFHTKIIEKVQQIISMKEFLILEKIVDAWLD